MPIKKIDEDALKRAMVMCKKLDPDLYRELSDKLEDGYHWEVVAQDAATWMQYKTLNLKPWESPPSYVMWGPPTDADAGGRLLLQQMLDAGLSQYEPDPLRALEARKMVKG